jgi:hypothetical protein
MVRRSLLLSAAAAVALACPAAAQAAPAVVGTAVAGVPQDCQAGCIGSLRLTCAATDAQAVRTTVRCWTRSATNALTSWQDGPAAVVQGTVYNPVIGSFTFCVEGTARYANGTTATTLRCTESSGGAGVVAG